MTNSVTVTIGGISYTGTLTAVAPPPPPPPPPNPYARPAGNTGTGLYVAGGRLNDPNGKEFRIRGVNRCHQDSSSWANGVNGALTKANAVRVFVSTIWDNWDAADLGTMVQSQHIANKQVPIVTAPYVSGNTTSQVETSGNTSPTDLMTVAGIWVAQAPVWVPLLNPRGIVNMANEWGPADSSSWSSANVEAIQGVRAAGYLGPILIDAGGSGEDAVGLEAYAAQVLAGDPQKNVLFGFHAYYATTPANVASQFAAFAALRSQGVCVVVSEFGPGQNIGPAPTLVTPQAIIAAAEANDLGWMPWAWDDNNEADGMTSPTGWFGMTLTGPGNYATAADLTAFGQSMLTYWESLAEPSTVFA
jgi:hypothetical protein